MAEEDFNSKIIAAVEEKTRWYDTVELPKIQENYRLHLTCVRNLFSALVKKSLIHEDPYKKDKKISNIVPPENTEFNDNERTLTMGIRLSDYESMIDFICNYMKFSVDSMNMAKIKQLVELNNSFTWSNLSTTSAKPNTKGLAILLSELRSGAPQITLSLIKDVTYQSTQALNAINDSLKQLADFLRESYKVEVRKTILMNPKFNRNAAYDTVGTIVTEIKRLFPVLMEKRPLATDLITEIAEEEVGNNKEQRQKALLAKLQVETKENKKKEETIDVHAILLEAVRCLGSSCELYNTVLDKIENNHEVLQSEHNSFGDKLKKFFRKVFNLPEPQVDYTITLTDQKTQNTHKETIHYTEFIQSLAKRAKYYNSFSVRNTPGYSKLASQSDDSLLEFLNRQIIDNNKLLALLTALDDYFKNTAQPLNRGKIKGIKMELTSLKNVIVKTNQHRADYASIVEEQEQMKKLGITENK